MPRPSVSPFARVLEKLRTFDGDQATRQAAANAEPELAELNRQQLLDGQAAGAGAPVAPRYKSDRYARKKQAMNPRPGYGTPDLRLTGNFQDSITAKAEAGGVTFAATDEKAANLVAKYGAVLGLNPESVKLARGVVLPGIRRAFRDHLRKPPRK